MVSKQMRSAVAPRAWLVCMLLLLAPCAVGWSVPRLHGRVPASTMSALVSADSCGDLDSNMDAPRLLKLLSSLRRRKDWQKASATLWSASARERLLLRPIHYNVVLAALSDAAQWEQALMLLEHMPAAGMQPDVYSYAAAISACSRASEPDRAISLFKQMCATDVRPNAVCFNAALAACQRMRRHSQLIALFGAMPAYGVQPDAWAYSSAIDAVARLGQWERALELLADVEL
eukprot:1560978-Prymnesium_polylepis.1